MTTIEGLISLSVSHPQWGELAWAAKKEIEALQAENAALRKAKLDDNGEWAQRRAAAVSWLERNGYRYCDIPACNCGSYHQTEKFTPYP